MTRRSNATAIMDEALNKDIHKMLEELGHPPLVGKIFPKGWENEPREKRLALHGLCVRSFSSREATISEPQGEPK